ncbi:hypothetical protein KKC94_00515 [Patescibacteria group bacterium]|nr:hypothetical protein [Patescibacteria group bacterium]
MSEAFKEYEAPVSILDLQRETKSMLVEYNETLQRMKDIALREDESQADTVLRSLWRQAINLADQYRQMADWYSEYRFQDLVELKRLLLESQKFIEVAAKFRAFITPVEE